MQLGARVARTLEGAWRVRPPAARELDPPLEHLAATGTAALAWWRLRHPALADAHRLGVLQAARAEARLHTVLDTCAHAGIEPLLIKGWTVARLYPARGLRPLGDVDLVFSAHDERHARRLFPPFGPLSVDLDHRHLGAAGLDAEGLFTRSRTAQLGDRNVRVLSPEDDLLQLCTHFLSSGGWRALCLCDIAVALETRPADFDWDRALGHERSWVLTALALARDLLGADVARTPAATAPVPRWVTAHVLAGFERHPAEITPKLFRLVRPRDMPHALRSRWPPDPLRVNVLGGAAIGDRPRRHLQVAEALTRGAKLLPGASRLQGGARDQVQARR